MTTIREELLEATGVKLKKKEIDAELIKRLVSKAEDLDEEGWESLSTEAQEFYNSVIEAGKEHADGKVLELSDEDVPEFPDEEDGVVEDAEIPAKKKGATPKGKFPDEDDGVVEGEEDESGEDEATENEEEEEVMEKKAKPAVKKAASKKAITAEKPAKKVAASKKNGGEKTPSMRRRLRQIIIKKPTISVDALVEKLEGEGYKITKMTAGSMRSSTRDVLKLLVEAKILDIEL